MKIKKNLGIIYFLKLLLSEIQLLILILFAAISLAVYISKTQVPMIKETNTKATISLPPLEIFAIHNISHNIYFEKIVVSNRELDANTMQEKFKINLFSNLMSSKNLKNFLDIETNSIYIKFFEQNGLDIKNYFDQNKFEIISSPIDKGRKFIFIISMRHPLGLNELDFLQNYIEFTKDNLLEEHIVNSVNKLDRIRELLQNNFDKNKNLNSLNKNNEDNRIKLFKILLDEFTNNENNISNDKILDYLTAADNKLIIDKIEFLDSMKNQILITDYDPILEIKTIPYFEINLIYRNIAVSILISFIVFFSIIFFKQAYKDFLKK